METKSLMVQVGADTKEMEAGLNTAGTKLKGFDDKIKKVGKTMTVAGAAVVGALGLMVKSYVKAGDEVHKMSLRTGLSTEALSEFKYAAEISGTSLATFEKGVKKMASSIGEAKLGLKTYTDAFKLIGMEVEELDGLNPEEQFMKMGAGIASIVDPTQRAYAAQKLLGRAGTELLPLFAEGADGMANLRQKAIDLGLSISGPAAAGAAKLNDSMTSLKGAFSGVTRGIAEALAPTITALIDKVTGIVTKVKDWIKENPKLSGVLIKVAGAVGIIMAVLGPLLMMLPFLAGGFTILWGAITGPVGIVIGVIALFAGLALLVKKNWEPISNFFSNLWKSVSGFFVGAFNSIKKKLLDWAIGIVGILEKIPFVKKLAGPWQETLQSMRDEMDTTSENVVTFGATLSEEGAKAVEGFKNAVAVAKEETGLLNQGLRFLTEGAAAAGTSFGELKTNAEENAEAIAEANKKISDMTISMVDEIKKATLDEYEYSQWALEQKFLKRTAAIEEEKASEASKMEAIALARESYRLDQEALEAAHIKALYDKRKEDIKANLEREKELFIEKEVLQIAYKDAKEGIINTINSLVMSELDYAKWAMDEERKQREEAIEKEIKDEDKKAELLKLINDEYRAREESERKKHADKMTELETNVFGALQTLYRDFIDDTLQGFIDWGEGTGTLLEGIGTAFKNLATNAIQALKSLLVQELLNAAKTLIAKKVEAIASVIASVMKSIPFPLNLVLVGVGIAAVTALFSKLKLKEGGLVTQPTTALIGEAGPELVIPLDKLKALQPAFAGAGGEFKQYNYFYGDIHNVGDIDEISRQLAEKTRRAIEQG